MFKHFIFDFDGVISNSRELACEEINKLSQHGFKAIPQVATQEDLAILYCGPLKTSLCRFGLEERESKAFFDKHSAAMLARAGEISPFEPVLKVIADVIPGRASIVTSAYSDAVRNILSRSRSYSTDIFRYISGRELHQPKSEKIHTILRELRIPVQQALHFGDMVSDLLYSREVPITFCATGWGYHPICYLRAFAPNYSVASFDEFHLFLKKMVVQDN